MGWATRLAVIEVLTDQDLDFGQIQANPGGSTLTIRATRPAVIKAVDSKGIHFRQVEGVHRGSPQHETTPPMDLFAVR
jgi:hypothetical protein